MTKGIVETVRRAYLKPLLVRGALAGFTAGALAAAALVLLARAFAWPDLLRTAAPSAMLLLSTAAGALLALRGLPSRSAALAQADDSSRAGGLFLVSNMEGADAWAKPRAVAPHVPYAAAPYVKHALLSLAALAIAAAVPKGWFASSALPRRLPFPDVTAELRDELDQLRNEEKLAPEEISALEEEIARIEENADPSSPGETLDAMDLVRGHMEQLLKLDEANLMKLVEGGAPSACVASIPSDTAQQLRDMLQQSGAGGTNGEESPGDGEGEGEEDGEGKSVGSGSPERGPGDADMTWKEQSTMGGAEFKDQSSGEANRTEKEVKVGESKAEKSPDEATAVAGLSTAVGGAQSGLGVTRRISPRHRGTVRRFFEKQDDAP